MTQEHGSDLVARYRERIDAASGDRQTLVDIHFEMLRDSGIYLEGDAELQGRVEEHLEALGGWGGALPTGLELCPYCGEVRDSRPGGQRSVCLCGGIYCRSCGAGRIRRPISANYRLSDRRHWHMPHFGNHLPCRRCAALRRRLSPPDEMGRESPANTAAVSVILGLIREAADALRRPEHARDDPLPDHDLLAVHGGVEEWHSLHLGAPPDSRPLYVGRSTEGIDFRWNPHLRVAVWRSEERGIDLDTTLHELLVRWQPPMNDEVETPWHRSEGMA